MLGKAKKEKKVKLIDTLISVNVVVSGNISFTGGIQIDGCVRGDISAEEGDGSLLRVSQQGKVIGQIYAPNVIVNGRVDGDVYAAEHLELSPSACITGDVYYRSIEMQRGAQVNGKLLYKELESEAGADGNAEPVDGAEGASA